MSKKKNEPKKLFEDMSVEPEHGQQEKPAVETESQDEELILPVTSETQPELPGPSEESQKDFSADDILDDVRKSLIEEEEAQEKADQPKWWKRIGKGSRKKTFPPEPPKEIEEINLPNLISDEPLLASTESKQDPPVEEIDDPIDELIGMLDKEEIVVREPVVEETPPEPEKIIDIEELKKQAFQPRTSADPEENLTEVRSIALEGDEEVFVEVETPRQDPMEERIKAVENALKPYQRYIYFGIAVLGLVMAVIAGMVLYNAYQKTVAAPTPEFVSDLPFPTSVSLPGGWAFQLGKGSLVEGRWNPKGAEWLIGTEVCRWVSLPYSRQLEAVLRTLNPDDPIDLGMSNNDVLTYKVYSIEQMSPEEMQKLDSNSPCLLIVLAEPDAEKRWVLTALP